MLSLGQDIKYWFAISKVCNNIGGYMYSYWRPPTKILGDVTMCPRHPRWGWCQCWGNWGGWCREL